MSFVTKVWRLPDLTLVEEIEATTDPEDPRTFDEEHLVESNELGRFSFSTYEADAFDIQLGDIVAFFEDDTCLGGGIIRQRAIHRVGPGVEGKPFIKWVGVRPLGVFEHGAIRPARSLGSIALDRVWGWFGVSFDDSGWGTATEIAQLSDYLSTTGWFEITPTDFFDQDAYWIWDASGTDEFAATGDCYFRQVVTATTERIEIELVADAQADLYLEGQRVLTTDYLYGNPKPPNVKRGQFDVAVGPVLVAVHGVNNPDYDLDGMNNPGGVAWSVWSVDPATGERDAVLARSDDSVTFLGYPSTPPGVTPGEVLLELFDEFNGSDYFPFVTPTFTADLDSNDEPWAETGEVGTKVGYSFWKLIQQLTEVYIDTDVDPDTMEWHAWSKGTRGADTAVVFAATDDPATSNVRSHTITETLQRGNQILHYSRFGWWLASNFTTGLRIDATLGLGALESYPAVQRYAEAQLEESSENLVEHDIDILPVDETDTPVFAFGIADRVTIGGNLEVVQSIRWRRDRQGRIHWEEDEAPPLPLRDAG